MLRRAGLVALAAVVLAVALAALATATGRSSDDRRVEVIKLDGRSGPSADLDLGDEGYSIGDRFVFTDELQRDGDAVGRAGGECVIVAIDEKHNESTANCVVTVSLPKGQIATQGLVEQGEDEAPIFSVAITGGTGDYRTARGEVKVDESGEDTSRFTVTLLR